MKYYARIENNIVMETIQLSDNENISEMFHPDLIWIECDDSIKYLWNYNNGAFSPPLEIEE